MVLVFIFEIEVSILLILKSLPTQFKRFLVRVLYKKSFSLSYIPGITDEGV